MKKVIWLVFVFVFLIALQGCKDNMSDLSITIQFDSQGGTSIDKITIDSLDYQKEFDKPTKEGYTFVNWYIDLDDDHPFNYDFKNITNHQITLYAKWEINHYKLTLVDDQVEHEVNIEYHSNLSNESSLHRTKEGYRLLGWFINLNDLNPYELTTMPAQDLTLYAKWEKQTYQLIFKDFNGSVLHQANVLYDDFLEDAYLENPTRIGYTFNGWDIDLPNKMPGHHITATATYLINRYSVTFVTYTDAVMDSQELNFNQHFTVSEPSREGHLFLGWYLDDGFENQMTNFIVPANNITLYAKWEKQAYTISFDTLDTNPIESINVLYKHVIDVPIPERNGFIFDGWYFDLEFENAFDWEFMHAEDIRLVAKWLKREYHVNYYLLGGTNHEENPLIIDGSKEILLYEPTMEGFTFLGWYLNHHFSGDPVTCIEQGVVSDIELHAKWQVNYHTISYMMLEESISADYTLLHPNEVFLKTVSRNEHTLLLTSEGRVFGFGGNVYGQLGSGDTSTKSKPVDITDHFGLQPNEKITNIYTGNVNSAALTSLGRVFIWGSNEYGQLITSTLGDPNKPRDITQQFQLFPTENITSMAIGQGHILAVTNHARVFTWGLNNYGQLGNGFTTGSNAKNDPTDITFSLNLDRDKLEYPKFVCAEDYSSIIVTSENRILVFGRNSFNMLGVNSGQQEYLIPYDISSNFNLLPDEDVLFLDISSNSGGLFTSKNRIFTWGYNGSGQLGIGKTSSSEPISEITQSLTLFEGEAISSLSVGPVTILSTTFGRVFMAGSPQLMVAEVKNIYATYSTLIDRTSFFNLEEYEYLILSSDTGHHYRTVITSEGRVLGWGHATYLGMGSRWKEFYIPESLYFIDPIILSEQTYFYTQVIDNYQFEMDGYQFMGWFCDSSLETAFVMSRMIDEDVIVYGYYKKIEK